MNGGYPQVPHPTGQNGSSLPPLPAGVPVTAGLSCPDMISRTLNTLPPRQILDVLSQMKTLTSTDPQKATELLHQAPQLSYAIFQALLLMGLVSTDALASVVEAASQPVPSQIEHYGQGAPNTYPPGFPPPPPHMSGQLGMPVGTPPAQSQHLYPPPPPQRAPPPQQQAPVPDSNDELIQQVLNMPQELIDQLPPTERTQLMALRQQFGR